MTNVSGGFAGINETYNIGDITWLFDATQNILKVNNSHPQETIYDGLDSGIYTFEMTDVEGKQFIFINDSEFGSYTVKDNELVINQNEFPYASGADGFIMVFHK